MNKKLEWRIYYGNGKTFDNLMGSPEDAPAYDVQVIMQHFPKHGRKSVSLYDYYYYRDGEWWGGDLGGVTVYLEDLGILSYDERSYMPIVNGIPMDGFRMVVYAVHKGILKLGKFIKKEEFYQIVGRAEADNDFPLRTAKFADEITGKER